MKEMTKARKDTCSRVEPYMLHIKKVLEIEKNNYNMKDVLREKYKNILGSKEPIIVLQKYFIPHACNEDYRSSKQSKSMYLTKDTLGTEQLNIETVKTKSLKHSINVKNLNKHIPLSLCKLKKSQNTNSLPKSKHHAVTMNETNSESDLWEIKHDAIMKAEALENAKKLKVCLKNIALYNKNANIVSVCNRLETSQINTLKKETKDEDGSSTDIASLSNIGWWGWNKSIISDDVILKDEYDSDTNFNAYENRRKNPEHIDLKNFSHNTNNLSTAIISTTNMIDKDTLNAQISDTNSKQILKERSTFLETNKKQDLVLKKEAKDHDSFLNRIPCENFEKTNKISLSTNISILPKNLIRTGTEKGTLNKNENKAKLGCSDDVQKDTDCLRFNMCNVEVLQNIYPELNFYKVKPINTYTEISKAELSNIIDNNVLKKGNEKNTDNSVVEVTDSVKMNYANAKTNNERNYSTSEKTACKDNFLSNMSDKVYNVKFSSESSYNDNKIHASSSKSLSPGNYTTDTTVNVNKCSNNVSTATLMKSTLSSNNALKREAECGVVNRQKIASTKEETEKISTKTEHLYKKANLSKQKRANSNESIHNESTKKIKLNTSNWLQSFGVKRRNDNSGNVCDNTGNIIGSSTTETVPQLRITSVSKPNIITQEKGDGDVQVAETKSKNEEGILKLVGEKQIATFGSTNKQDWDSLQNAWESIEITSETHKSPAKDKFLVSSETNCNEETITDDEDEESDCISLFADSTLMAEYDTPVTSARPNSRNSLVRREKSYVMTDNVFENYYKSTTSDFNKAFDSSNADNGKDTTPKENRKPLALGLGTPVTTKDASSLFQNPQECKTTTLVRTMFPNCFRGYCYRTMRINQCNTHICPFKHEFVALMVHLYVTDEQYLFEVIDQLVSMNCVNFVKNVYEQIVILYRDVICILKLFKRLYELNVATSTLAVNTIVILETNAVSVEIVVNNLATIVGHNDSKFVNWIVKIIGNRIIHHIRNGKYWDTLRALLLQVKNLEPEIIEIILRECITTRKNIQDVHENIVIKLNYQARSAISQNLLLSFKNLLKCTNENETIKEIASQSVSIGSPDTNNPVNETENALITNQNSVTSTPKVWTEFSYKTKERDDNNNAQSENSFFILHPIDDLPKQHSVQGREIFWKFYLDVHSLQEGLKHDDHDHVMKILNAAEQQQKSLFSRACYQILCNEVKYSQYHLSKLVLLAVQIGATPVFYEILLDVAIHILARLAEEELWVLAFKLLKDVDIVLKMRIRLQELNAVTILLLAEIYLANYKPVKAFTLLKQTNIICTNRNKWKAPSNAKDDYIRAQVVALLLDRLCEMSPHHAIFLFQFLVTDQPSNFSPVDLTQSVNKMVSAFLLKGGHELINIGELIDDYNFTLNTITYRALIAALVPIDKDLAKQLYQNAVGLGIYSNIQFYPATYVIINCDWANEEMYLVISDLMQQLSSNIGHAIDHISLRQLSIYLIFESIPSEKQLACDRGRNQQYDKSINESKARLATVLQDQFNPPISIVKSKKKRGKLYKLQSISVRRYLQREHLR